MMRALVRLGGVGAGLLLVFATPAAAQEYPPAACTIAVSDSTVDPGQQITVSGTGSEPNSSVTILFDDRQIGTTTTDANGSYSTEITIPEDAQPGEHTIRAVGAGCDTTVAVVTVLAAAAERPVPAAAPPAEPALAITGSDARPMVWIALALLAFGTTLVVGAQRRVNAR